MIAQSETSGQYTPSILFVTNNDDIREFCRRELERDGYRVDLEGSESQVPDAVQQEFPDLVILDTYMPMTKGLSLMQKFMVCRPRVPVILFSVRWARTFIEKSENLARLRSAVARVLTQIPRPRSMEHLWSRTQAEVTDGTGGTA